MSAAKDRRIRQVAGFVGTAHTILLVGIGLVSWFVGPWAVVVLFLVGFVGYLMENRNAKVPRRANHLNKCNSHVYTIGGEAHGSTQAVSLATGTSAR